MSENDRNNKRRAYPPKSATQNSRTSQTSQASQNANTRLPAEEFGVPAQQPKKQTSRKQPQQKQQAQKKQSAPAKQSKQTSAKQTQPKHTSQKQSSAKQTKQPAQTKQTQSSRPATIPVETYHAGGTRRPGGTRAGAGARSNAAQRSTSTTARGAAAAGAAAHPTGSSARVPAAAPSPVPAPKRTRSGAAGKLRIIPLGGLLEIGKNITLYEYGDDIIAVDCGMSFPEEDMFGVDIVMPDLSYLFANKHRVKGVFITHGHEDHIGAISYMLREMNPPIYATPFARGLIEGKLEEAQLLRQANLVTINPGEHVKAGMFEVEAINVNHSTPDAVAYAITTPLGVVIQTGDFKIDSTPIAGEMIDLARFGEYGRRGVLALLSDSTNVERPGYTMSERAVGETLAGLFKGCNQRIIVTTFASNVHRLQQIIDAAVATGRKVAISGRSMENVIALAVKLGYVNPPAGTLIDIDAIKSVTPSKLVIVTTGSQGETLSALSRMAFGTHRQVSIGPGDRVIISASPIPGNENSIARVINELMKRGADVIYRQLGALHVSGHACQEELKIMLGVTRPQYFLPVHGEYKMLRTHADLAKQMGVNPKNIFIGENGRVLEFSQKGARLAGSVPAGQVLLDGTLGNDVGDSVIRDRRILSEDGIVIVAVAVDRQAGVLLAPPEVITRGFVSPEGRDLRHELERVALEAAESSIWSRDVSGMQGAIRGRIADHIRKTTKRQPLVVAVIQEG